MDIQFSGSPAKTTSPICGCDRSRPIGTWRGLTVPAADLTLRRTGGSAQTVAYGLFSAPSSSWTAGPVNRGIRVTVAVTDVPTTMMASPDVLLAQNDPHVRAVYRQAVPVDMLSFSVDGALHVRSMSDEPIGAVSVPKDSEARVRYRTSPATPTDTNLRVSVPYGPSTTLRTQADIADIVPLFDVLGPRTAIWGTLVGDVRFGYNTLRVPAPVSRNQGSEFTVAMKTVGPDKPAPDRGWQRRIVITTEDELFALRLAAFPADHAGASVPLDGSRPELGQIDVNVPNVVDQATKLVPAFAAANREPNVRIAQPFIPFAHIGESSTRYVGNAPGKAAYEYHDEVFQRPPTPPASGLNVFGSMRAMTLTQGVGEINIGADDVKSIVAPAPMVFKHLSRDATGGHALIAVRQDTNDTRIDVSGRAEVTINRKAIAMSQPWPGRLLTAETIAFLITVAGAASTVGLIRTRNSRKAGGARHR